MRFSLFTFALAALSSTASAAGCNGDQRLCSRSYANVTQMGAHNSPFVGELPSQNQGISVSAQLAMGIRLLTMPAHNLWNLGTLYTCHTSCYLLNTGPLHVHLRTVAEFLSKPDNKNEVVTLILTNPTGAKMSHFEKAFKKSGLDRYLYIPPQKFMLLKDWPTLQGMADSGRRVVVFIDYSSDMNNFPQFLDQFAYTWETPFSQTDPEFGQCRVDRPSSSTSPKGRFGVINHTLNLDVLPGDGEILVPHSIMAEKSNSVESIMKQMGLCERTHGARPNFVLLDYVNKGQVMQAQRMMNVLV